MPSSAASDTSIDPHDKGRGYEVRENQYVVVEEELERAREEKRAQPSPLEVRERAEGQPARQTSQLETRKITVQPAEVIPAPPRLRIENILI